MKTSEILTILEEKLPKISYTASHLSNGSYKINYLERTFSAINELAKLGFLDADIRRLKELDTIYTSRSINDQITVTPPNMDKINHHIGIIREKITGYIDLIKASLPPQSEETINIKLPQYQDLEDVTDFFSSLDKALKKGLMNPEISGTYNLNHFENGSLWIGINVSANVQLLFSKIIKLASRYEREHSGIISAQAQVEQLRLDADIYKSVNEGFESQLKAIDTTYVNELTEDFKTHDIVFSNDSQNNLKFSIRKFSTMIQEGAEFHPSLAMPEEVRKEFPLPKTGLPSPTLRISEQDNKNP